MNDSNDIRQSVSSVKTPKSRNVSFSQRSLVTLIVVILIAALSFFLGMNYQKGHDKNKLVTTSGANGSGFNGGFGGQRRGGIGSVTAVSPTSITVQNRDGSSTTYSITSSTTITSGGQPSTISDIQTGDTVIVMPSSSSSTTAGNIIVNPSFGGGFSNNQNAGPSGSSTGSN